MEYEKRTSIFKFHQHSDLRKGYRTSLRGVKSSTLHEVFEKTGKIFDGVSPNHRTALPLTLSGGGAVSEAHFCIFLVLMFPLRSPRQMDSSPQNTTGFWPVLPFLLSPLCGQASENKIINLQENSEQGNIVNDTPECLQQNPHHKKPYGKNNPSSAMSHLQEKKKKKDGRRTCRWRET